ncbi:hypothetical protein HanIR_Chr15g0751561 [Helianthus annuus]|nr:hypothetical protein HanIR_Chr15g0751561 [Helianthus annuus]
MHVSIRNFNMVTTKNHVCSLKRKRDPTSFIDSISRSQRFTTMQSSKSQCNNQHRETILNVDKATISSEVTCVTNDACINMNSSRMKQMSIHYYERKFL